MKEGRNKLSAGLVIPSLIIAVITFAAGIIIVFVRPSLHHNKTNRRQAQTSSTAFVESIEAGEAIRSDIGWVYITTAHDTTKDVINGSTIIALKADGTWLMRSVNLTIEGDKLNIMGEGHEHFIAAGRWDGSKNGELLLTINDCEYSNESIPLDGGHKQKYPLTARWLIGNGKLMDKRSTLSAPREEFRLVQRGELMNDRLYELFSTSAQTEEFSRTFNRKCLREDLDYFVEF